MRLRGSRIVPPAKRHAVAFHSDHGRTCSGVHDGSAQAQDADRAGRDLRHRRARDPGRRGAGADHACAGAAFRSRSMLQPAAVAPVAAPQAAPRVRLRARRAAGARRPVVKSPMVGTFYRSASPGAKPFVEVGDTVQVGDTLCIIEAMKLMNEIEADAAGDDQGDPRRERSAGRIRPAAVRDRLRHCRRLRAPAERSARDHVPAPNRRLQIAQCRRQAGQAVRQDPDRQSRRDRAAHPARVPRARHQDGRRAFRGRSRREVRARSPTNRSASARRLRRRATSTSRRSSRGRSHRRAGDPSGLRLPVRERRLRREGRAVGLRVHRAARRKPSG